MSVCLQIMDAKVFSLVVKFVSENVAAIGLAIAVILFLRWYFDRDRRDIARLPGPKPWPLIGNVNLMWSKGPGNTVLDNVVPLYHELSKQFFQHGFFAFYFGSRPMVMIFKPEVAEALFTSSVNISKAPNYKFMRSWLGNGLLLSTGSDWKQHRKLLTVRLISTKMGGCMFLLSPVSLLLFFLRTLSILRSWMVSFRLLMSIHSNFVILLERPGFSMT